MDWLKKHVDTVIILSALATSFLWMHNEFRSVDVRFATLEKDIAVIKTVLIMKQIMPCELAKDKGE